MAFLDIRFPEQIAYGALGGPGFSTNVVEFANGREQRNINWDNAVLEWDVSHGLKKQADLDVLIAFFRQARGKAHTFRFKDWSDYQFTGQTIGTGDGTTKVFQLVKRYGAVNPETRKIVLPVNGTVKIYKAGVLQTSGYTINYGTGVVTFTAAPATGAAITADGEFDVLARFDTDSMKINLEDYDAFTWGQIMVKEVVP